MVTGADLTQVRQAVRIVQQLKYDVDTWIRMDASCPVDRAPRWCKVSQGGAQAPQIEATKTANNTSKRTAAKTTGTDASKRQRSNSTEKSGASRKGTFISTEAGLKLTFATVFKGCSNCKECMEFHTIGEECPHGSGCKYMHNRPEFWEKPVLETVIKNGLESGKFLLNIGLKKNDKFMAKFNECNVPGKEKLLEMRPRNNNGASN